MFTTRWRLFHLFGIPIYVDASWLIILALLTLTLTNQFRGTLPDLDPAVYWLYEKQNAVAWAAALRQYVRMSDNVALVRHYVTLIELLRLPSDTAGAYVEACERRCLGDLPHESGYRHIDRGLW